MSAKAGNPAGPCPEREIEHIHNLSLHKRSVWTKSSNCSVRGLTEDEAVAKAVYNVAKSSGSNEREPHKDSHGHFRGTLKELWDPPAERPKQHNAEDCKDILPYYAAERHAKGHALVLNKHQLEPVAQHRNAFSKGHVGLDQDFYDLVYDHKQDAKKDVVDALKTMGKSLGEKAKTK